jgi:hypothetical protein
MRLRGSFVNPYLLTLAILLYNNLIHVRGWYFFLSNKDTVPPCGGYCVLCPNFSWSPVLLILMGHSATQHWQIISAAAYHFWREGLCSKTLLTTAYHFTLGESWQLTMRPLLSRVYMRGYPLDMDLPKPRQCKRTSSLSHQRKNSTDFSQRAKKD